MNYSIKKVVLLSAINKLSSTLAELLLLARLFANAFRHTENIKHGATMKEVEMIIHPISF